MIDLRSDTVTKPSEKMLEAMFLAKVGDDVFGEDTAINELQDRLAAMFGQEAGLFCPSGTMTNQIAIRVHTRPGDEVICSKLAHVYLYEGGGIAGNAGSSVKLIGGDDGLLSSDEVEASINGDDAHLPKTSLVCIEDTMNKGGGCYYDLKEIEEIREVCTRNGLGFHLDGARLFNALIETGYDTKSYGENFDSISICLSKGMGCPVGSVLLGSKEFIRRAHRVRKSFGGGMRQAGYLASAGLFALDNNRERLIEDHQRARSLGVVLSTCSFVESVVPVKTNIVIFNLKDGLRSPEMVDLLKENCVLASAFGPTKVRLVTHLDFDSSQLSQTEEILTILSESHS